MRSIQVSLDVFQAIWAGRMQGEDSEDAILRRLLKVAGTQAITPLVQKGERGFTDKRYGVLFPHGFEVFRTYLGKQYLAIVVDGRWELNGRSLEADTINKLSAEIGIKRENGWANWNYRTPTGDVKKIGEMRDPNSVPRRSI